VPVACGISLFAHFAPRFVISSLDEMDQRWEEYSTHNLNLTRVELDKDEMVWSQTQLIMVHELFYGKPRCHKRQHSYLDFMQRLDDFSKKAAPVSRCYLFY
jgi:hypothetical protein